MKQSRISMGLLLVLPLVAITLLWSYRIGSARSAHTQSEASAKPVAPFQQLSSDGQGSLRAIIQAGNLSDLRWPNFSDYDKYVQKFYESYGFSLPWVRGMQPTAQAQQLIALLLKAEQEGLSAEDYDGPRWTNRLAASSVYPSSNPCLPLLRHFSVSRFLFSPNPFPHTSLAAPTP